MLTAAVKLSRASTIDATLDVARDLLGKVLVHNRRGVRTSGIIVEVEAYIGEIRSRVSCRTGADRAQRAALRAARARLRLPELRHPLSRQRRD